MRQDSFCKSPGQCPVQHKCARNLDTHDYQPPIRIYETFIWQDTGCEAFKQILQSDKLRKTTG